MNLLPYSELHLNRKHNLATRILLGLSVGDALGVPVEFLDRHIIARNPVTDMVGFGTHHQPAGTFSDDSSLAFCLAESLTGGYNLQDIADKSADWFFKSYWAAHGKIFDVGIATRAALDRVRLGHQPQLCGGTSEDSNGNGSLMRILPLVVYLLDKPVEERWEVTKAVSSITHGHVRSAIACFYYLEFARCLIEGKDKFEAYKLLQVEIPHNLATMALYGDEMDIFMNPEEIDRFQRLLTTDISQEPENKIYSSGYVLHTLEASIWCLLTTDNYPEAVLKAVNLGSDTDTTGCVTGGLAGILYGWSGIPKEWVNQMARLDDILNLGARLDYTYSFLPTQC